MVSFRDFKYFYGFFYIFGQAPYYPLHIKNRCKSKIIMFLPFVVLILNAFLCSVIFIKTEYHNIKQSKSIVLYTLRFSAFVPNFVVIYESLAYPYGIRTLNYRLFFICDFLKIKLKTNFQLVKFKSECFREFCMCFALIFISNIIRMKILTIYDMNTEIAIFAMQVYKMLALLHALFYTNLFKFILISMNNGILRKDSETIILSQVILNVESNRTNRLSTVSLQQTRFIYLKLWEVIRMFNTQFGWSLFAIMLESLISTTNAFYAAFIYFADSDKFIQLVIRKFSIHLFTDIHMYSFREEYFIFK